MGYDYYNRDDVTEYLAEQRQRIADLEAENRALRTQLDALCRGEGVAVLINGCRIPLAALAAAADAGGASASRGRLDAAHGRTRTPSVPRDLYHHPAQRVPMPAPHTPPPAPSEAVFPEEAWLTSPTPAAHPQPQPAPPRQRNRDTGAHALRPSERITPEWLREARHSAAAQPSTNHAHQDAWADSYSHAQLEDEPAHFATLAQITGQRPAMRPQRRDPNARNPYADSFVLD